MSKTALTLSLVAMVAKPDVVFNCGWSCLLLCWTITFSYTHRFRCHPVNLDRSTSQLGTLTHSGTAVQHACDVWLMCEVNVVVVSLEGILSIFSSNVFNVTIFGHGWGIVRIPSRPMLLNLFMLYISCSDVI